MDFYDIKSGILNGVDSLYSSSNWNCHGILRCSAPIQSLLQKWLREEHNIDIQIHNIEKTYYTKVKYWEGSFHITSNAYIEEETYEQALEKGLQEALKLINS